MTQGFVYERMTVQVTLRCNAKCQNCSKFVNTKDWSGLDLEGCDLSDEDIEVIANDLSIVAARGGRMAVGHLRLSGGEPLLHERIVEFYKRMRSLAENSIIGGVSILTNGTISAPVEIAGSVENLLAMHDKESVHLCSYVSPEERSTIGEAPAAPANYKRCQEPGKKWIIASKHGYSRCCISDGYARMFGADELFLPKLVMPDEWPNQDHVCKHCAFGMRRSEAAPKQSAHGRPISPVFLAEAEKNKAGRSIPFKLGKVSQP